MGAIKDLVDLVTQLNDEVTDRKFAQELREVQRMIGALQSEHAEIHEKRIEILEENVNLRQEITSLKEEIYLLKQPVDEDAEFNPNKAVLDEEERILILFTNSELITAGDVSKTLNCNTAKSNFWLSKLRDQELIGLRFNLEGPTRYSLNQRGREYLVAHGHV